MDNSPRIEHSRKHGPFDPRYPTIRRKPAPASLWRLGEERLDWQGFLARFYPDSRRHDSDALAAYQSYLNDAEARPADDGPLTALRNATGVVHAARPKTEQRSDEQEEPPATADTERWESDGGASAARPRRRRPGERPVGNAQALATTEADSSTISRARRHPTTDSSP